jgi:glycosyltransferase involved in cell wall biosynthesis
MNPLISVLMTSYNREKYIGFAIESLLGSTYQNFELIIVDDQSKDKTVEIAQAYAGIDHRIKVYINERNIGDYPNRNQAASYAKGKYLKYLDADDLIYPRGLEILVNMMEQFPEAGYGLCSLQQDKEKLFPFQLNPLEAYYYHYFGPGLFHKAPLSSIIRRDVFEKIGGFTGKQHVGDFELWHLLSRSYPVVLMPQGIVWYREHDDQQMTANRTNPIVPFKYLYLTEKLLSHPDCPLQISDKNHILTKIKKQKVRSILGRVRIFDFGKAKQMLQFRSTNF